MELLVSLVLLSLMTIYSLNALSTMRDTSRIADGLAREHDINAALRHIRDSIAGARPHFVKDADGGRSLLFDGDTSSLTFATVSSGERERGGLYMVQLALEEGGILVEHRQLLGHAVGGSTVRTVIMSDVSSCDFQYGSEDLDSTSQMRPAWTSPDQLPATVAVRIAFGSGQHDIVMPVVLKLASRGN